MLLFCQLSLRGVLHHHFQQFRSNGHQVYCTICSHILLLGGSNIAPMFSGPTLSGVLHLDVTLVLFSLVAAAPHPRPVNMLVIDFMSMVSLLCALQLFYWSREFASSII